MSRSAIALFCDDVRREENRKKLLIGVYEASLLAPSLPFTIPQLFVLIIVRMPPTEQWEKMEIRVIVPGREDAYLSALREEMSAEITDLSLPPTGILTLEAQLKLEAIELKERGAIVVKVKIDEEEFLAGALDLDVRPTESVSQSEIGDQSG